MTLTARPSAADLLNLSAMDPQDRAGFFLDWAQACAAEGDLHRAAQLIQRAWDLGDVDLREALQEDYLNLLVQLGRVDQAKDALRGQVIALARAGRAEACLAAAEAWQYAHATWAGRDTYVYDAGVLGALRDLAAPHQSALRPEPRAPGDPLRVAYLVFGATHHNSVIVKLTRTFAVHHDPGAVRPGFFFPDLESDLGISLQGLHHLRDFKSLGHPVHAARGLGRMDGTLALARNVEAFRPHVLVTTAALADFRHYLLASLFPGLPRIAHVSGPLPQFAPPDFDLGIAWTLHPQLDCPIPCAHVSLETPLPAPRAIQRRSRAALGLPEDAVVVGAAGRPPKFRDPGFWQRVAVLLAAHPGLHLLVVGTAPEALGDALAPVDGPARARVHFAPWQDDYLSTLGVADMLLDTHPSGGGVVVLDMMALGRPVLSLPNDYSHPFDQVRWAPGQEFLPPGPLMLPFGDEGAFHALAARLIGDPAFRERQGAHCQAWAQAQFGNPERMVRRCEALYRATADRAASPSSPDPSSR